MAAPYGLEMSDNCATCSWRGQGFFCDLSSGSLKAFEAAKYTSSYPAGAILFIQGQVPRGVYLLCKGRVKLTMTSADGKSVILQIVQPGEIMGINNAITGQPFDLTAETLEPCQVNFIKRDSLLDLLNNHQDISSNVTRQLCNNYQTACGQIRSLGLSSSASERVARFLLDWSARGKQTSQGIRVNVPLTHEEIAQSVGISRETVTRTLTDLRSKAVISTKGPSVVILDKAALQTLAAE